VLKDKLNEMIRNLRETTRQEHRTGLAEDQPRAIHPSTSGAARPADRLEHESCPSWRRCCRPSMASSTRSSPTRVANRCCATRPATASRNASISPASSASARDWSANAPGRRSGSAHRRPGDYVTINSGLGEATPLNIIVLPILFEGSVRAVVELASFNRFSATHQPFLDQLTESIGLVLNTIEANTLTENLLKQSQSQAQELQSRQEDLRASNQTSPSRRVASRSRTSRSRPRTRRSRPPSAWSRRRPSSWPSRRRSGRSSSRTCPTSCARRSTACDPRRRAEGQPHAELDDEQVQYAGIIQSSGTDLLRLLNDVLDLAKVESGTVTLEISELSLLELKEALEWEFRHVAGHQGVSFVVELEPGTPPIIATDPGRLRQVLKNLLANAFKFTERGTVTLRMGRPDSDWRPANDRLSGAAAVVAFSISDTGIGIAPELQQLIFEAFAQADGTAARQYGGSGLGLSISRELVSLLGGEMRLESTLGVGSTFAVYLPSAPVGDYTPIPATKPPAARAIASPAFVASGALDDPESVRSEPADSRLAGRKVLVVDDDIRNIFAVTVLLERGDADVLSAESGEEAIAAIERTPDIDLVLMDIMMPVMDGYAAIRAIRNLPWKGELAIIALTAKIGAAERDLCLDAGATGYIAKPVENGPDFIQTLSRFLADREVVGSEVAR